MMKMLAIPLLLLTAAAPATRTQVKSEIDAKRLRSATGVTLQWIDWNTRGSVYVVPGHTWYLSAAQVAAEGPGRVEVKGNILSITKDAFVLRGTIRITDTPDRGRSCEATRDWHFAITQNRPYYRLRDFEWCDYLTDYIDIYF